MKQFNVSKLHQQATSQQQDTPFSGGQRISGGTADFLNHRMDITDALREYQGGVDAPEAEAPAAPVPSRFEPRKDVADFIIDDADGNV